MVLQRFGLGLLTLFVVSIIIFVGVEFLPGDIAEALLGQGASPENVAALRHELGLDRPAHIRYIDWWAGVMQGDLGNLRDQFAQMYLLWVLRRSLSGGRGGLA